MSLALRGVFAGVLVLWTSEAHAQGFVLRRPELRGGIVGRVCLDVNRNGRCEADEPGQAGIRVVLETGQESVTDADGRYHLAFLSSREPGTSPLRLAPGRHRVRLDDRSLPASVQPPDGMTVEIPMGSAALQDFALKPRDLPQSAPVAFQPSAFPPAAKQEGRSVKFLARVKGAVSDQVVIQGQPATASGAGDFQAWVPLASGANELEISVAHSDGSVTLWALPVDVISRPEGALIVPRPLQTRARVEAPVARGQRASTGTAVLRVAAPQGSSVSTGTYTARVGKEGTAELPVLLKSGANRVPVVLELASGARSAAVLEIEAQPRPLVVGLLDLEAGFSPRGRGLLLTGRGAAHADWRAGPWQLAGELDLRDEDFRAIPAAGARLLWTPRSPDRLFRALDPEDSVEEWADDSPSEVPNAAEGRLRIEARHERFGTGGFGSHRAVLAGEEVGRYRRSLFGPYVDVTTGSGRGWELKAKAFGSPPLLDPLRGVALAPAHEEHRSHGGSLFYLARGGLSEGTETVQVERRDGRTGVVLSRQKLTRGIDYEVDASAGRILLRQPLAFLVGVGRFSADTWLGSVEPVLVVDYEYLQLGGAARGTVGSEVTASAGPVAVSAGATGEHAATGWYVLGAGKLTLDAAGLQTSLEVAKSRGSSFASLGGLSQSGDGGWSVLTSSAPVSGGEAAALRLKLPNWGQGRWSTSAELRTPGYSDGAHVDYVPHRQVAISGEQPLGPIGFTLVADHRQTTDPRLPYSTAAIRGTHVGLGVWRRTDLYDLQLEVRDASLRAAGDPRVEAPVVGERTTVGLSGRYALSSRISLLAAHQQSVSRRGAGPGSYDDTLATVGARLVWDSTTALDVRAGYGPALGPVLMTQWTEREGPTLRYGGYTVDVDGPDIGEHRSISGARTGVGESLQLFVEEGSAFTHEGVRQGQTLGLLKDFGAGWSGTLTYFRGARSPLATRPPLIRDAGGATVQWLGERARASVRAELRKERGSSVLLSAGAVDRLATVLSAAGEVELVSWLVASGRLNFAHSVNAGRMEQRLVEASTGLAARWKGVFAALRYSVERELPPPSRGGWVERSLHVVSLLPAIQLHERLRVSAGVHLGVGQTAGTSSSILSAALRPSVRVVKGLEVAAEGALRSAAPGGGGGSLHALRGEVGYRFNPGVLMAAGYNVVGFTGLGLGSMNDRVDRFYLRAEVAH